MITVGKTRRERTGGWVRLTADVGFGGRRAGLWFGVPNDQEKYLTANRADPFVAVLLPFAMRFGEDISAEDPVSERLHFQLRNDFIPSLSGAGGYYKPVSVLAPLTSERAESGNAVVTGFSGGVDSMYTVFRHGKDCEYPLTHLAVFNSGVYEGNNYREEFLSRCGQAAEFALGLGLGSVFVDSNIYEVLPERYLDVATLRLAGFALAIQGLCSVFLISSGYPFERFSIDVHHAVCFDPLTVNCFATESLSFYLSGAETGRIQKIEALSEWEPSYEWLSPCIRGAAGKMNCGHCKKCVRDLAVLYALGSLDRYRRVFDTGDFMRHLPERLGFVMANVKDPISREVVRIIEEKGIQVPPLAYRCRDLFREAMERIEKEAGTDG
jgi:hypothetical protein